MLQVPVFNPAGQKVETLEVDEALFGSQVNVALLKQAIVAYHANKRQGTAANKSRSMVEGSTRKLFKQKGTGNARRGPIRTPVMKGGGRAFAKQPRDFRQGLPKKMRHAALNSALLAKMLDQNLLVVAGLKADQPKTKMMVDVLAKLKIERTCLVALAAADANLYKSIRNIRGMQVCLAADLNAFDVTVKQKMLVTREAMTQLLEKRA